MPDLPHGRVIQRGKPAKATDYLPIHEVIRLRRSIEVTEAQRNAATSALAIAEGQIAAHEYEIDGLKRVVAELRAQRDEALAKVA